MNRFADFWNEFVKVVDKPANDLEIQRSASDRTVKSQFRVKVRNSVKGDEERIPGGNLFHLAFVLAFVLRLWLFLPDPLGEFRVKLYRIDWLGDMGV